MWLPQEFNDDSYPSLLIAKPGTLCLLVSNCNKMQGWSSSKVSIDVKSYLKFGTCFLDLRVLRSIKIFNQRLLNQLLISCCDMDHDIWISDFALANLCFPEGILCAENAAAEIIIARHFGLLWLPPCVASNFSCLSVFTSSSCPFHSQAHLADRWNYLLLNVWFSFYCCFTKYTCAHVFIWAHVCFATHTIHTSTQ